MKRTRSHARPGPGSVSRAPPRATGDSPGNVCHNAGVRMPDEDAVRPWSSASRAQASGRGVGADERAWGRRSQVMLAPLPRPGWDR
jgi:hypothetical protein